MASEQEISSAGYRVVANHLIGDATFRKGAKLWVLAGLSVAAAIMMLLESRSRD